RGQAAIRARVRDERERVGQQRRHLRAVSPRHTLDRGYAVVRHTDTTIVRDRDEVAFDELLQVTVARGDFAVRPVSSADLPANSADRPAEDY
ncbi:MAG: exodeoxyribonuclease VII large subunit, partial [Ornithinimicrobium sp.]